MPLTPKPCLNISKPNRQLSRDQFNLNNTRGNNFFIFAYISSLNKSNKMWKKQEIRQISTVKQNLFCHANVPFLLLHNLFSWIFITSPISCSWPAIHLPVGAFQDLFLVKINLISHRFHRAVGRWERDAFEGCCSCNFDILPH